MSFPRSVKAAFLRPRPIMRALDSQFLIAVSWLPPARNAFRARFRFLLANRSGCSGSRRRATESQYRGRPDVVVFRGIIDTPAPLGGTFGGFYVWQKKHGSSVFLPS